MAEIVEQEEEKKFEYFPQLPPEVRIMMIDEMEIKDRCRIRRCSQQCNKEATNSKKFTNFLKFNASSGDGIRIMGIYGNIEARKYGFMWSFGTYHTWIKYMAYRKKRVPEPAFHIELDESTNLSLLALSYFKKILKSHQYRMERLEIVGNLLDTELKDADFEIENLNCLKWLDVSEIGISQFVPKLRRPLKMLRAGGEENNRILPNLQQTYQVQNYLGLPYLKLNKEQFMKLSASRINIHIGYLTIDDIYDFIKAWQNGFIRDNFQHCCWGFDNADIQRYRTDLFARFGATYRHNVRGIKTSVEIKQKGNSTKKAILLPSRGFQITVR